MVEGISTYERIFAVICFCGMLLHLEYKKEGCQYVSRKLDQVLEIWVGWKVGVPKS